MSIKDQGEASMSIKCLQLTVLSVTSAAEHPPRQPATAAEAQR